MWHFSKRAILAAMVAIQLLADPVVFTPSSAAADLPYLFQRLKQPTYKRAFTILFKNEKKLAPWLRGYLDNRIGVDTPGRAVDVSGRPYELYAVCEPHNCAGNFTYVLFASGGRRAWALFTEDGGNFRFFGAPDPEQRTFLTDAAKE